MQKQIQRIKEIKQKQTWKPARLCRNIHRNGKHIAHGRRKGYDKQEQKASSRSAGFHFSARNGNYQKNKHKSGAYMKIKSGHWVHLDKREKFNC